MPVGQLLTGIASVHSTMGIVSNNKTNFFDSLFSSTSIIDAFNWKYKSFRDFNMDRTVVNKTNLSTLDVFSRQINGSTTTSPKYHAETLSFTWYLASFGALIVFFILISFSEIFCRKMFTVSKVEEKVEVSPPPYELFAPPAYDSLYNKDKKDKTEKAKDGDKIEIFVVPMVKKETSTGN